jgi:hypothetical protein
MSTTNTATKTSADALPDYAPVLRSAMGPARKDQ